MDGEGEGELLLHEYEVIVKRNNSGVLWYIRMARVHNIEMNISKYLEEMILNVLITEQ